MRFFKQTIKTVPIEGKTVLVRADYNVPLKSDGTIDNDFRIRAGVPTIKALLKDGCKVVIISHLGRPDGITPALTLEPVAQRLAELLGQPVRFVGQTVGDRVKMAVKRAPKCSVTVLENLRFDPREEANDIDFARQLARDTGARYFVQDGFGVVHRAHASTAAITHFLPSVSGMLLAREYVSIMRAMQAPKRPLVVVMGGAKVSDKIEIITKFIQIADTILIGGAMANTFLAHKGSMVGSSKVESDQGATIDAIYAAARKKVGENAIDDFLVLPTDLAVASAFDANDTRISVAIDAVQPGQYALDIGDKTIETFVRKLGSAKTVIWNGTLGRAELPNFAHGSARMALALATQESTVSIIGGGDTADFVLQWDGGTGQNFDHVSTGGGASLELMAGKKLPGIESLLDA